MKIVVTGVAAVIPVEEAFLTIKHKSAITEMKLLLVFISGKGLKM